MFYGILTRRVKPLVTLGEACKWTIYEPGLSSTSNVLCAGAGHDISFEKSLISRYGCNIVLVDPSPTGIATVREAGIPPERLRFLQIGLAGMDGALSFAEPDNSEEGSFRQDESAGQKNLRFDCRSISSLMKELGWTRIDLLKIDIEGLEYDVIRDILDRNLRVKQICVEFHYGALFGIPRSRMIRELFALRKAGYRLVHHVDRDHTFIHAGQD